MSKSSKAKRAKRRRKEAADLARDKKELGSIRSSSGHGGIRMAGLRPPKPGRFRKYKPRTKAPHGLSIRELADQMYREAHG